MRQFNSLGNRVIAFALSIIMLIGMFPTSVFAINPSSLTTDIGEKAFVVGKTTEFTFTTTANSDAGEYVLGTFEFSDPSAVEKLEYLESQTGTWYEFYGDFGPAGTGFPMTDATSQFRVTFNKAGEYTVKASMVTAEGRNELCSVTKSISVARANPSVLSTNIGEVPFVAGKPAEFTFTTTANEDSGTYVLGTFEFSDPSAVEKLEYRESQTGTWYEFYGDFGPAGTGFPMTNATSQFRVTFNKVGTYSVTASMVTADNRTVLCSTTQEVTVSKDVSTLTTNIGDKTFVIGKTTEFTFTTTANADAGTYVFGTFEFSDPSAVEKLEYLESQDGNWYEFSGDFGPAGTGFPMANATSQFRVTFNKVGTYTVTASMVTADNRTVLCSVEKTVTVADTSKLTTNIEQQSFVTGQTTEFTFTTTANGDAGIYVLGSFVFSDPSAIEKLEYLEVQSGQWFEFYGDFGPAGTGFQMGNATSKFRVTFKKAGSYTLSASMKTVADGTILCKVDSNVVVAASEQTGFVFESTNPVDQWIGNTYKNVAVGGQTNETIIYEIVEGPATIAADGTVTFTGLGAVTVKATRPGNDFYKAVSATYVVTSVKNAWEPFGFTISNPTITYAPNLTYPNANLKNDLVGLDSTVTFAIVDGGALVLGTDVATIDPATGVLTILKFGVVTVRASRAADSLYTEATAEYTVTVEKADQIIAFETVTEVDELTYQTGAIALPSITGKLSEKDIVYTITVGDGEIAKIEDGKLQLLKAGYFEMTVVVPTDERYEESNTLTWKVTVNKANQTGFDFAADNDTITYNDVDKNAVSGVANEYTMITSGGQSTGAVTYEVVEGDAAVFNKYGILTIKKAGTVKIKATKAGDEKYNATESYFELTVEKDEQSFTFNHNKQINEKYGLTSFETQITKSELNSGTVTYAVSGDNIGATVNNLGVVTFGNSDLKVGTITVTVTMVENNCYLPFTETYTITLSYETTPAPSYALHGDKIISDSEWFTGDVTISAPNDYQISYSNDLTDNEWNNDVEWKVDGEAGMWATGSEPVVYLKNSETGAITDAIPVSDLKRDTVKPNGLAISYDVSVWATIGEKLFGFNASTVKVTVTAADSLSGISKMEYSKDGGATYTEITANNGKYEFDVESQCRGQLWMRATDVAGNPEIYKHLDNNTDKILVVDHTEPGLTVGYTGSMNDADTSGIRYVNSDKVTVVFEITDENFDLRAADPIVTVNGVAETGWVYDATSGTLTFDLADEGDYVIKAEFTDRLDRKVSYESEVRVDRTKPVIESTIVNGRYYTENQAFVLTITEHNFDASKVNLDINAVDSKNNPVLTADEVEKFADDAKVLVNWDHTEGTDIYTLKLPVTKDGNYTVNIDCTDVLGWNEEYEVAFTLDKVAPTASVITYETVQEETIMSKLFGFSKETVRVSIQTSDLTSGVDYIQLNIIPEGPAEATDLTMPLNLEINADGTVRSGDKGFIDEISVVGTADDLTFSFNLPAQFRGFIEANAYDKAAWNTESVDGIEIVVDSIAPGLFAKYTGGMDDSAEEGIRYVNGEKVSVAFEITDENFDLRAADPVVTVNGVAKTGWVYDATSGTLTFDLADEGDYVIKAEFTDRLDRKVSYESEVRVDRTKPVIESDIVNKKYYTENQTFVLTITEHNFDAAKVNLVVNAVDSKGAAVLRADEIKKFADDAKVLGNWNHTEGTDVYTLKLPITKDGNYAVTIECTDVLGWNEEYEVAFTLDKKAPVDLKIEYSEPANTLWQDILRVITFGAYNAEKPLIVTLSATDEIAGVDYFEWFYTRETGASESNKPSGSAETSNILYVTQLLGDADASVSSVSFEIDPQARGYIIFRATDYAGNTYGVDADPETEDEWVEDYERINIVDTIAPNRTITLAPEVIYDAQSKTAVDSFVEGDDVILYYEKEALVTIDILEANFYADDVQITVTKNGEDHPVDVEWEHKEADHYQGTFTLAGDGDYAVEVSYVDRSQNEMVDLTGAYTTYTSPQIHIDDTIPVISVSYEPEEGNTNGLYFKEDRVATVKITEHNFDATKVKAVVTAKNILGKDVTAAETTEIATYLSDPANWTEVAADVYEAQVTFATDAHYTFSIDCADIVGNPAETYEAEPFVVDHEAPAIDPELDITYSTQINSFWQNALKTITFGAYNPEKNAPLIVTLTAKDEIAGVDYFEWFYTREAGASETNTASGTAETSNILYVTQLLGDADASVSSVSFEIEPEARGYITFRATDYAGNTYGVVEGNDDQWVADTDRINIVDTIAPGRTVTLKPNAAYNAETLERVETFVEEENVILYYKERPVITIDIVEANFYGEDVQVFVTTDPEDLSGAINYSNEVSWNSANADEHQGVVTLKETDGDYYVVIMYTDRSLNEMVTYTSQRIVVDETLPEITVEYANKPENALNTLKDKDGNDRQYFFEDQTAVISIKEKNFRADDVKIYVRAQDLLGKNVNAATLTFDADGNVVQYFAQGANRGEWEKLTPYEAEWRREDNTYKLELHYSADANYTFDIVYADMATNEAKDYEPNYFTVDKVAPTPLAAEYSTEGVNVFDNILAGITFGFYDAKMTVTISASDEISGVHRFAYSYLKSEGVSPVNAELLNEAIESAKITQVDGTYTYTASFEIPKEVLTRDNQFNGTVEFSSFDRSENKSEAKSNTNRIIVDNIAPTATISYNAPVKQLGNVSYYAGDINATIVINEANFFSEDVVVTVNDKPVAVSWSDNSVDVHTGTFTLSSDGDYVVKVTYTDRSTNKMEDYASNQLTIDTKAPVIQVSDVKHESANNGETISFTVQVTDRNIALENFKPTLSVLVKKDNGNNQYSFETVAIDLGQAKTSVNSNGDTVYTYTVENLEVDGFYSLVCEAVDHANHTVSSINSANNADQKTTVETVNFSVNREGSVFWITTEHTEGDETIVDQLQGKYVNGEVIVRIHEINVDKVDDGKATIFTLNDGSSAEDIVLDETNYKKNVSIGAGGWYQTDYTLDNSYFAKDGVYSINIITYDKATNSNVNTKSEEGTITFTVDRTKPVISANLTSRQIINDTQYKVYFQITELNLDAETIVVKYNGETVALENLGNNEYSFTVKEGLNQSVQITAVDLAGNEAELYKADPFTVSTNIFVRWYATGFWFWFPIIAVPLLIGLIILLIVLKKKKKER